MWLQTVNRLFHQAKWRQNKNALQFSAATPKHMSETANPINLGRLSSCLAVYEMSLWY